MKRITSFILTLIIITAVAVYPAYSVTIYTDGDYSFTDVDSENVALYNYTGESDVLVIPEQFSGRMVSEVYDYAFENNTALTALDFSQNGGWLKNLGVKCFAECTSLTGTLNLPSSIRKLGLGAFQGCTGLSSLTINIGVRDIPRQCFNRCSGLQTVYLPSDLETIDDLAFGSCDYLDKVYIPRSVSYISSSAFARSYPTLCVYYKSYAHQYAIDNISRNFTLEVEYEAIPPTTYSLTIKATGNGVAAFNGTAIRGKSSSFTVTEGTSAVVTFTPDTGYKVKSVVLNGTIITSNVINNQYTINAITAEDPMLCVAIGTGMFVEYLSGDKTLS